MADIFVSYARQDLQFAEKLAKALETRGWSVWWDRRIAGGDRFSEVIAGQLKEARCCVTVWSSQSVGSRWVYDEAGYALEQKKLVPVLADAVDIPLGFRGIHAVDLRGWRGNLQHAGFQRLAQDISDRLDSAPQPEPKEPDKPKLRASDTYRAASWLREAARAAAGFITPVIDRIAQRLKAVVRHFSTSKITAAASACVFGVLVYFVFLELREEHTTPAVVQNTTVDGILAQVTRCERNNNTLSISLQVVNNAQENKSITLIGFLIPPRFDEYYLFAEGKKYLMLRAQDNVPVATPAPQGLHVSLDPGRTYTFWAKYTAPPPDVKSITFYTPIANPFEDVPITGSR
jgi:hypothetical protein